MVTRLLKPVREASLCVTEALRLFSLVDVVVSSFSTQTIDESVTARDSSCTIQLTEFTRVNAQANDGQVSMRTSARGTL